MPPPFYPVTTSTQIPPFRTSLPPSSIFVPLDQSLWIEDPPRPQEHTCPHCQRTETVVKNLQDEIRLFECSQESGIQNVGIKMGLLVVSNTVLQTAEDWFIMQGIALQSQEKKILFFFRLRDLEEIEEVNANCILMAKLLSKHRTFGVEQSRRTVEQHPATVEETVDNTAKTRRPQPRSNRKTDRVPSASKSSRIKNKEVEVEEHPRNLFLSKNKKHMSSECNNIKLTIQNDKSEVVYAMSLEVIMHVLLTLRNLQENGFQILLFLWQFLGTVRFGNDHIAAILGYGDLQWGNIFITKVYFIEGLGHNLYSVGQFCDSDLEVSFKRNTCLVRNLEGVDLLKGNHTTNLYTINLHEMASACPICLMAHATSTKSWLWHQRLSHLNVDTINDLAKNDLITALPKVKYHKEHLCPSCEQGKGKKASHPPKPIPNSKQRLHLLRMDLCGPMIVESINGKRSKDEAPEDIKTFLRKVNVLLQALVIIVRTDNGTEFKNQVLKEYFDFVGISHQASSVKIPQQNGVVERRNRTLVEASRTMLIFSCTLLFLWAEAITTTCYTQNRSIIYLRFGKTPYELINCGKPYISFLYVFGALCYPNNDREDIGKLGAKGDIVFFIGYSATSCAYRVYNRRTKKIMERMNVTFDELSAMAFEQRSSKPGLQSITSGQISLGLDLTYAPSTITSQKPTEHELDLLFEAMYDDYIGGQPSAATRITLAAQEPQVLLTPTASTTTADTVPTPTNSSSQATVIPNTSRDVNELEPEQQHV
ncbi:retrovirus-related pol polyprotein from transposon TNT 1-94 [Tanacetum coccineum]